MFSKTRLMSPSFSECETEILETSICLNWAGVLVQYFKKSRKGLFPQKHCITLLSITSSNCSFYFDLNWFFQFFQVFWTWTEFRTWGSVLSWKLHCFYWGLLCNRRILNKYISGCLIANFWNIIKNCFCKKFDTIDKFCILWTYGLQSDE